jgi:hypothetical protein
MKIKAIGTNQTELHTEKFIILFSYNTPVCGNIEGRFYKTSQKYSRTTSKHVNQWLDGIVAEEKSQEFFDNLVK